MKPREIDVHIEELVLHGFKPASRWQIAEALEQELRGLLTANGVPSHGSPARNESKPGHFLPAA